jgi:hypothetical protein
MQYKRHNWNGHLTGEQQWAGRATTIWEVRRVKVKFSFAFWASKLRSDLRLRVEMQEMDTRRFI